MHCLYESISRGLITQIPDTPPCKPEECAPEVLLLITDRAKEACEKRQSFQLQRIVQIDTVCLWMGEEQIFPIAVSILVT